MVRATGRHETSNIFMSPIWISTKSNCLSLFGVLRADEECPLQAPISQSDFGRSSHKTVLQKQGSVLAMADSANSDDSTSPPSKYKSSLLNRYLNDTLRHMMAAKADGGATARKRRSHSESFSSNDCDRDVVSPASSYETEANFVYQMGERCQLFVAEYKIPTEFMQASSLLIVDSCPMWGEMTL